MFHWLATSYFCPQTFCNATFAEDKIRTVGCKTYLDRGVCSKEDFVQRTRMAKRCGEHR
jgi:hypothetical protein